MSALLRSYYLVVLRRTQRVWWSHLQPWLGRGLVRTQVWLPPWLGRRRVLASKVACRLPLGVVEDELFWPISTAVQTTGAWRTLRGVDGAESSLFLGTVTGVVPRDFKQFCHISAVASHARRYSSTFTSSNNGITSPGWWEWKGRERLVVHALCWGDEIQSWQCYLSWCHVIGPVFPSWEWFPK